MTLPSLYADLAPWFHLLTAPEDYAEEAEFTLGLLREHGEAPLETMLELGSGGGNTASHLKRDLHLTLTDLSPQMLDLSRTINPECEHIVGDMRTMRLERTFDAVFVHDAISYLTTEADLRAALETAFVTSAPAAPPSSRPTSCAKRSPPAPTTAVTTGSTAEPFDTSSGEPIRIPTTRRTSPTTPSCSVTPTARSRSATTSTSKGCSRGIAGWTC